jgi:NADH-quinone oxidoreductase subunit L
MVFFGEAKWHDASEEHGAHGDFKPHESPPVMFMPLVALAGLSIVGGIIQLPAVTWIANPIRHKLEDWLHPMIPDEAEIAGSWGSDHKTLLMVIATAAAAAGIAGAIYVYQLKRAKAVEPVILENAWYYDKVVSDFMGGPGREAFEATAWFDANVVDGAVNGSGISIRGLAGIARKAQSGFVRMYAGIIGVGVAALLAWFVIFRGVL